MLSPKAAAAGIGIAGGAFSVLQLSRWSALPVVRVVNDLVVMSLALAAAGCALSAARRLVGRQRMAWLWIVVALGGFAVGQFIWTWYSVTRGASPFQSAADLGYMLWPVGTGIALLVMLRDHPRSTMLRTLLDGVVVSGALFGAAWAALLATVYAAKAMDWPAMALTLMYPVAGIAVVTIAMLLLVRAPVTERRPLAMLTAGLALVSVADIAYAYVTAVDGVYYEAISLGYAWGFVAVGAAALLTRARSPGPPARTPPASPSTSMWLPIVPVAAAVLICAPALLPLLGPLYVVGATTIAAVMIRQLLVLRDNRRLLAEVSDRALRDPLTGLANRTLFTDRLTHALALQRREARAVAVLLIDLDDFKLVNDSLGHPAGDVILARAAERITNAVRASDTVARLGGDEFAVLMEGDPDTSRAVARQVVAAFDRPFLIDGQHLLVRLSSGLAISAPDCAGMTVEELLKQADVAMYSAKRSQSGAPVTFTPDIEQPWGGDAEPPAARPARASVSTRASQGMLRDLQTSLEHDGLSVVYQPKFDLRSGIIAGVEALVRWQHPSRGVLTPDQFLPLVRQHGLMRSVTTAVVDRALDDAAQWWAVGVELPVAVNVFAPDVRDRGLPRQLAQALQRRGLPPEMLTVEITEDLLLENLAKTRDVLTMLREYRIRIAIDDFGSGYSALWYLREFPVDEFKLDRHFIAPITTHASSAVIVRALVDLAHALDIVPVAEGVENAETARLLLEYGCEVAQGYHFSKPLSAAAVLELVQAQRRSGAPRPQVCQPARGDTGSTR
ncbi:MAG: bifunctional diguanylate cyclase/phosphodiesterase [Actinomycetota bacterium]|nr:bifunctional diguanylate cyclase/phosphodiesterase [Actinomycetota bacterium]